MNKVFWVLIEGPDDKRFVENILRIPFEKKLGFVQCYEYQNQQYRKRFSLIRSISSQKASYAYFSDKDYSPCILHKKNSILGEIRNIDAARVFIVIPEIESWYLAGLDNKSYLELRIPEVKNIEGITKENFNLLYKPRYQSRVDFMMEVIKRYSIKEALNRSRSFAYMWTKLGLSI